jgi:hypothetical protein
MKESLGERLLGDSWAWLTSNDDHGLVEGTAMHKKINVGANRRVDLIRLHELMAVEQDSEISSI